MKYNYRCGQYLGDGPGRTTVIARRPDPAKELIDALLGE
jgi:hypothetical protein